MTEEQQRIAIAEACPDTISTFDDAGNRVARGKGLRWEYFDGIQWNCCKNNDPLQDLNAMHEAEKILTEAEQDQYAIELSKMVLPRTWPANVSVCPYWLTLHTTAAQRAEAFLRTKNICTASVSVDHCRR